MHYNRLGNSELNISKIALGCMSLKSDSAESSCIIEAAYDCGINYFDTADLYDFGENEVLLGKALKKFRDKVYIATKVGNRWKEDRSGWTWDVSAKYIFDAVDTSLKRLQTDYIDVYQIHGGTKEDNFEEVLETLETLKAQGKIRYYGISSIRPNVFLRFTEQSNIISNMMQYSMLDTRPEKYFDRFKDKISVLARGAYAQGVLLGKAKDSYLSHSSTNMQSILTYIEELASQYQLHKETIALAYVLRKKVVASSIVGIRTMEQFLALKQSIIELDKLNIVFDESRIPKIDYTDHLT